MFGHRGWILRSEKAARCALRADYASGRIGPGSGRAVGALSIVWIRQALNSLIPDQVLNSLQVDAVSNSRIQEALDFGQAVGALSVL